MKLNLLAFRYLYDAEEVDDFIKKTVKVFRTSEEYSWWRHSVDASLCVATGYDKLNDGADIEVHHFGKTLYEIIRDVVFYFIENELPVNTFYILLIIQELHINDCIDYVPLLHCIHKMIEDNYNGIIDKYPNLLDGVHYGFNKAAIPDILNKYKENLEEVMKG